VLHHPNPYLACISTRRGHAAYQWGLYFSLIPFLVLAAIFCSTCSFVDWCLQCSTFQFQFQHLCAFCDAGAGGNNNNDG
jgi:hypothetical protein